MKKIVPHLWFDKNVKEAVDLYTSVIPGSKITHTSTIKDTPSGDCDIVSFELAGQPFMAIGAGPEFKFNPSISFHIKCQSPEEVDAIWAKLSPGANVLMKLGEYPFSKRYGWLADKYGLSWQVIYVGEQMGNQRITPVLMYTGIVSGKAEEAMNFYTSLFADRDGKETAKIQFISRYEKGEGPEHQEGMVKYGSFTIRGVELGAMDSAIDHKFNFNEAISLMVPCETQEEIDYFWKKLSAVPEAEQCGWLKDKYGVSWQIVATAMDKMMAEGTHEQVARLTQAFLPMKKFDIATLQKAFDGK